MPVRSTWPPWTKCLTCSAQRERYIPEKTKRKGQEALPGLLAPVARRAERRRQEATSSGAVRHLNAIPFLWDPRKGRRHSSDSVGERFREARVAFVAATPAHAAFGAKQLRDTRDTSVPRLWAANVPMQKICSWGSWAYETANAILKDHYLSLLEAGAEETADQLKAWAVAQGLDMAAA